MAISADLQLTVDGMPIFAHEACDLAAANTATMLLREGKAQLRMALLTGSHGAGKSTMLKLVDHHLRSQGVAVSWYNGWQHKADVDPFASILFALWDELDVQGSPRAPTGETVESVVAGALRRKSYPSVSGMRSREIVDGGDRSLLLAVDLIGQLQLAGTPISELAHASQLLSDAGNLSEGRYQRQKLAERSRSYLFSTRFREQLEAIKQRVRNRQADPHAPIFLFVDDLDRCPPRLGLQILEALDRYFRIPGLVIVVALDESIARSWAALAYEGNVEGKTYIDKLFDRRILGVEERARTVWAQILGVEWRLAEWEQLRGTAHPEMADRAVISATRLLRVHCASDIREIRRTLLEVRTIIEEEEEFTTMVTLVPDIARLGVLCGYLVREQYPRIIERISDLRLLEARVEVVEEMMSMASNWGEEEDEDAVVWLREFLELRPGEERDIGYILDIRHFLSTDVLINIGANLVLIGMGLR